MLTKHIVFLDQYGSLGGGQQVLLELARASLSLGYSVTVLMPNGPSADKMREMGANVSIIYSYSFSQGEKTNFDILKLVFWNICVFLCNIGLFLKCEIIYVNGLRLLPVAMLTQRILRRKAACHVHLNHGHKELALIRCFLKHPLTQAVVVPSPFIQRQLVRFDVAFTDDRVRLVENGLDARFANVAFEDRFTGKKIRHVAIVGRVSPEKGQDVLPSLAQQFPNLTFHVLGDVAFSDQAFANRVRSACPSNVIWHGWIDNLFVKIAELGIQVVLVPSRNGISGHSFEAAPLVPLQMAALSCLVIVRRLGALEDVANVLCLRTASTDADFLTELTKICEIGGCALATEVEHIHQQVVTLYNHFAFQQRLKNLWQTLLT